MALQVWQIIWHCTITINRKQYLFEHERFVVPDGADGIPRNRSGAEFLAHSISWQSVHIHLHVRAQLLVRQELTWDHLQSKVFLTKRFTLVVLRTVFLATIANSFLSLPPLSSENSALFQDASQLQNKKVRDVLLIPLLTQCLQLCRLLWTPQTDQNVDPFSSWSQASECIRSFRCTQRYPNSASWPSLQMHKRANLKSANSPPRPSAKKTCTYLRLVFVWILFQTESHLTSGSWVRPADSQRSRRSAACSCWNPLASPWGRFCWSAVCCNWKIGKRKRSGSCFSHLIADHSRIFPQKNPSNEWDSIINWVSLTWRNPPGVPWVAPLPAFQRRTNTQSSCSSLQNNYHLNQFQGWKETSYHLWKDTYCLRFQKSESVSVGCSWPMQTSPSQPQPPVLLFPAEKAKTCFRKTSEIFCGVYLGLPPPLASTTGALLFSQSTIEPNKTNE